jgi:hypothetical protein
MKNIIIILSAILSGTICSAQSKGSSEFHANWEFGFPVGNSFVTSFSALGADIGYSRFIHDQTSVGIELGWNNYYQYAPRKTYVFSDGAATTDLYKYIYTLPIVLNVTHYMTAGDHFTPFVKLGMGAQYSEQNLYYNVYETTNTNWGFVVIPEIGTLIHFSKGNPWAMTTSIRYGYSTNAAKELGINSVQAINFCIGIAYIGH